MENLKGLIKADNTILFHLNEIGIMLFQEFPSTTILTNDTNDIYIREWVDCSDDGIIDRFFVFKTNKKLLLEFINGSISHLDFINNAIDKLVYFYDKEIETYSEITIYTTKEIPIEYLPGENYMISPTDIVDYQKIIDEFDLTNYINNDLGELIKDIAGNKNSDIYNLHLIKGNGISYGKIKTDILSKALKEFDSLYKNIALDIYFGKNRGSINFKNKEESNKEKYLFTEVIDTVAASFSIILKPFYNEALIFEEASTSSEAIATSIFNLLNKSVDTELFSEIYPSFSEFTMSSYKSFLNEIYSDNLNLEISYFSNEKQIELKQYYDINLADKIILEINNFTLSEEDNFEKIGKFRAINCNTGSFTFESNENETYKGFFDKLIKDGSEMISFTKVYKISINRKTTKEVSKERPKIEDVIIAFYENDNN